MGAVVAEKVEARPTTTQERSERQRLYALGKPELMKRVMKFDARIWNELVIYSTEYFVDRLVKRWADGGYGAPPSGKPRFDPDFKTVRSALYQLPHGSGSLAVEAEAALDAIQRAFWESAD